MASAISNALFINFSINKKTLEADNFIWLQCCLFIGIMTKQNE